MGQEGKCHGRKFHRHGSYKRWVMWRVEGKAERLGVCRYLCVRCGGTTSVLPWGVITYRLLSLGILIKALYEDEQEHCRDLLREYRRQWERWYGELWGGIGNLLGRLPRDACAGWKAMGFEEVNPKLVDQIGWSLFGRYRIHTPQRVI